MADVGCVIMNKVSMRSLDKNTRINNFEEVNLGYNKEEAIQEASRCLNCQNPRCVKGCPIGIKIPKFIEAIKNDDIPLAYEIIREDNLFPGICGRVCPQEKQCESMCIKGFKGDAISIGSLERYVSDEAMKNNIKKITKKESNGKRVAIVGSGPSGLACASILQSEGFSVTIYESLHKAGGVLTYGIPEFRLPKRIVDKEINSLVELGVEFIFNVPIGQAISIDELKDEYDAVYLATGAGLPKFMGIKNECANGVFSANEILTRVNLMESYKDSATPIYDGKKVVVVGCGNVAMDAARSLRRLGRDVTIVYRRSENDAPARKEELKHAKEEEIEFRFLTNPKEILVDDDGYVKGIRLVKMETFDDGKMKSSVREINNTEFDIECDMVVMALGTTPNPVVQNGSDIKVTDKGLIITEDTKTNIDKVYAGGDAVTGAATVILAYEAGKKAAKKIIDDILI